MARQKAETLLQEFGDYIGIPDLALDENNLCSLSFDDLVISISYREVADQLALYADIGLLPAPPPASALIMLLEANCLQPDGASVGIRKDEERNAYVAALSFLTGLDRLDQERFQTLLQNFLNLQESWRTRLTQPAAESKPAPHETQPPSSMRA